VMSARPRGLTLTEVVIVLAIAGLLIALVSEAISRSRNLARSAVCQSNLRNLAAGILTYRDEFKQLPSFNVPGSSLPERNYLFAITLASVLRVSPPAAVQQGGYTIAPPSVFLCPADRDAAKRVLRPDSYSYFPNDVASSWYEEGRPIIGDFVPFHWGKQNGASILELPPRLYDTLPLP
jgi:prepilin-type N-terminal cleavage/methylation domain-containing protein